jgi:hypothetical protein
LGEILWHDFQNQKYRLALTLLHISCFHTEIEISTQLLFRPGSLAFMNCDPITVHLKHENEAPTPRRGFDSCSMKISQNAHHAREWGMHFLDQSGGGQGRGRNRDNREVCWKWGPSMRTECFNIISTLLFKSLLMYDIHITSQTK